MSRGRRYDFGPLDGFRNAEVARAAAMLEEAAERLYDVLGHADFDMLHFIPEGSYLSIARLVKHMAWAEAAWIRRITGTEAPASLVVTFGDPAPQKLSSLAEGDETSEELCGAIRRLKTEYCHPALASIGRIESGFDANRGPNTVREVLDHLIWHWTYHSGQVGLTLLQAGLDYQWAFAENRQNYGSGV